MSQATITGGSHKGKHGIIVSHTSQFTRVNIGDSIVRCKKEFITIVPDNPLPVIVPPQKANEEIVPPQPVPVIVPPQPVPVIRDNACIIIQKHYRRYLCICRRQFISVVKVKDLVDLNKLTKLIEGYFNGIPGEMAKETGGNLTIDSKISEFMSSKCIDKGKWVGRGNGPIDVENDNSGIDVACLCLNGITTNEKSLGQKFKGDGGNLLDLHFTNKKDALTLDLFVNDLNNKLCKITKDIYYFIFISTEKDIYLSILSINPKSLLFVKSRGFSKQAKSIKTTGFINNKYGNVILYKSKKRLELRLNKCILEHSHHLFTLY